MDGQKLVQDIVCELPLQTDMLQQQLNLENFPLLQCSKYNNRGCGAYMHDECEKGSYKNMHCVHCYLLVETEEGNLQDTVQI